MRIIYLANQRMPTEKAYGIQIAKMCEAFSFQGVSVKLVIPSRKNPINKDCFDYYDLDRNFKVINLYSPDFYFRGKADKVAFLIKNFFSTIRLFIYAISKEADLIFSRDELPIYLLSFFKNNLVFEAHKFSKKRKIFYNRYKKANVKIVAISQGLGDEFIKLGIRSKNMLVAHDGVDINQFMISDNQLECRKKLNLPIDKKIIGYFGQLKTMGMEKGIKELISSVQSLIIKYPYLLLIIVGGSDKDREEYTSFAKSVGLKDTVLFLGTKEHKQIPIFLRACDILAMPFPNIEHYASYMSPLKLFEYMASGRPIVATNLPVIREILNNQNSFLVDSMDKDIFSRGISLILDDLNLADSVSSRAREDVKHFSWNNRAANILRFVSLS